MAIVNKPTDHFNTVLYVGNNSTNVITGVGFQPDLVWLKDRVNANSHNLYDSVRGTTKALISDLTSAEITRATGLTSFDSDGFTMGSYGGHNESSGNVGWNWKAGGTAVSNTDGSITSSVSANPTAGFSIVSYTGTGANATVGHGLGQLPAMIIVKNRIDTEPWWVYHSSIGAGGQLRLNGTNAEGSDGGVLWNSTAPTSTVFSLGDNGGSNGSSDNTIAYCFANTSMIKAGSYTGNGSTDGTFVYTGFKPAFVMLKSSSSGAVGWITHDNKRIGFNPNNYYVEPNNSNVESADTDKILLLSNGFKLISTSTSWNASGGTYIYLAIAENPLVTSTGIPATAK